ncbi:MAG: hypothetical protein ACR2P4_04555 [Gammaproteobacteria bacterium]
MSFPRHIFVIPAPERESIIPSFPPLSSFPLLSSFPRKRESPKLSPPKAARYKSPAKGDLFIARGNAP